MSAENQPMPPVPPNPVSAVPLPGQEGEDARAFEKWAGGPAGPDYPETLRGRLKFAWFAALKYERSKAAAGQEEGEWRSKSVIERKRRFAHLLRNKFGIKPLVAEHIACDFHAILMDAHNASLREKEEARDTARLNWLEYAAWNHPDSGNGIAIFPSTRHATGDKCMSLHGLGDEDGSNLGDDLTPSCANLREAIDQVMESERLAAGKEAQTDQTLGEPDAPSDNVKAVLQKALQKLREIYVFDRPVEARRKLNEVISLLSSPAPKSEEGKD